MNSYETFQSKELKLSDIEIQEFITGIDNVNIFKWNSDYYSPSLNGESWAVDIKTSGGVFNSSGSNAYPRNWMKFCKAIENVVQGIFR